MQKNIDNSSDKSLKSALDWWNKMSGDQSGATIGHLNNRLESQIKFDIKHNIKN